MLNIGKGTRNLLKNHFFISSLKVAEKLKSSDGSIKYRILLDDGNSIESVFLPHKNHNTICVSSQAGCAMGCDFCMTAKMGLIRNLEPSEIINQIFTVVKELPEEKKIRNIVFMGMGEPFHNYKNLMKALEILTDEYGFNFSQRRITVSTSGLLPKIKSFGLEKIKANLAVSLNGVTNEVRSKLMPVNKAYKP
jgi:Predicted Fe-S-cluster redox enzyme